MKRTLALLLAALMLLLTSCALPALPPQDGPASAEGFGDLVLLPQDEPADAQPDGQTPDAAEAAPDNAADEAAGTVQPDAPAQENEPAGEDGSAKQDEAAPLDEDGIYTSKEDVALYIYQYGRLPGNFITKKEAESLGWTGGSLEPYAPGKCIGGGRFGNYEGLLPEKAGRTYTECDIDTLGKRSRGAKRIVFSNDGLIYYTDDHYESFTLLYGEEDG